jgi:tetratricopeptide (TPR) repeat protein
MRFFLRVFVLAASPAIWAQLPATEVYSPLGKAFAAKPDTEHSIAAADLALAKGPVTADLVLAAARVRDSLLRFHESIPIYTRGFDDYPGDVRFPLHRALRFISTRKFDFAIADLKRAAELAPASYDVSFHLGLAYFLHGDYNHAAREYQRCLYMADLPQPQFMRGMPADWRPCHAMDDDRRVALTDWAWCAYRRAGKPEEAAKLLAAVTPQMKVTENASHLQALLLYKGASAEAPGFGPGLWHALAGRREQGCAAYQQVVSNDDWAGISFIAAEKEIAAGACKPLKKR